MISWTVSTLEMKITLEMNITTEIQQNVELLHFLNEKVTFFNANREKKIQFRAKIGRGYTTGGRSRVRLRTALKLFCLKMELHFPNFSLIWTSTIPKMKLQTKELEK